MPGCIRNHSIHVAPVGLLRACGGTTVIEFAMLLPVLLLMLLGVIEFGRLMWTQASLQAAVEAAARCLAVTSSQCSNPAQYVDSQLANYGSSVQPAVTPTAAPSSPNANCGYQVTATYNFTFIVANLFPWTPTLNAQSCYPG
jgi:Flp pilus assembly protein TadG